MKKAVIFIRFNSHHFTFVWAIPLRTLDDREKKPVDHLFYQNEILYIRVAY